MGQQELIAMFYVLMRILFI